MKHTKRFLLLSIAILGGILVSPVYAQFSSIASAIAGVVASSLAVNANSNKSQESLPWSEDLYESHLVEHLKKDSGEIKFNGDQRGFSVTTKRIIWIGSSVFLKSSRPVQAMWVAPDGDPIVTKISRFNKKVYRADLVNKKELFKKHPGHWQVRIIAENKQELDRQNFYIGKADLVQESKPVVEAQEKLDLSGEDAVVVFSKREIVLLDDFSSAERLTRRMMLLSDKGKDLVEIYLPIFYGIDDVFINYAYTIKPDGEIVDAREYGIQNYAKEYPDYKAFQFFTMTMPSLQKGSILEFQILITSREPKAKGMFFDSYQPRRFLPVIKSSYSLNVPSDLNVRYLRFNTPVDVQEAPQEAGRKNYQFSMNLRPGVKPEPGMPSERESMGEVILSTSKSWDEIAQWWHGLIKDKSNVSAEIQSHVDDLIKNTVDVREKIRKINFDVADNIRYVGFNFGHSIYEPADATTVFKNKYGDCKDQSMLLLAMLKAAGINAHTALASSGLGLKVQTDIPTLSEFNHVIVVAEDRKEKYFLDPTLKQYPFGVLPAWLENRQIMHVKEGKAVFEDIPMSNYQSNRIDTAVNLEFDSKLNLHGTMVINWFGQSNGNIRQILYQLVSPKQKEEFVDTILKGIYSYARRDSYEFVSDENVDLPLTLKLSFHMHNWLLEAGAGQYLLHLYGGNIEVPSYLGKNRKFPVRVNESNKQSLHVSIKIPDNFDVEIPPSFDLAHEYQQNHVHYKFENHILTLDQEILNLKGDIPLDQIDSLRSAWESIAQANRKGVLLKPKK